MNPYLSSSSLKCMARGQLLGRYRSVIRIFLLHLLCTSVIDVLVSTVLYPSDLLHFLIYYIALYLVSVLSGFFYAGECYVYLKIANQQPVSCKDLFYCFREDANRTASIQLILSALKMLCILPSAIYGQFFIWTSGNTMTHLLFLAGSLLNMIIQLLFSQCFYVMLDFESYGIRQIFRKSWQLIRRNIGRLFYLTLSFLPLYALSLLSCGIGFLWAIPYFYATYTNFYLDLIKKGNSL